MPVRVLHAADIHLDCAYSGSEHTAAQLKSMHLDTLRALADCAVRESVDALLLAGDSAQREDFSYASRRFFLDALDPVLRSGIPVFLCRGNHDSALSITPSDFSLPGFTIYSDWRPRSHFLRDRSGNVIARITGWGFDRPHEERFPTDSIPPAEPGIINIALAHLQVTDLAPGPGYAPASASELLASGYDYWALGHVHQRATIDGRLHYPGNLMGCNPGETGAKGASLVTLIPGALPQIEFIPLSPVVWADAELSDHPEAETLADAEDLILESLQSQNMPDTRLCARVSLTGVWGCAEECWGPQGEENLQALARNLEQSLRALSVEITAEVSPCVPVEAFRNQPHILSRMLDLVDQLETDDELADRIFDLLRREKIEIAALAGYTKAAQSGRSREYIRSLIPGLREKMVHDMTKEDT